MTPGPLPLHSTLARLSPEAEGVPPGERSSWGGGLGHGRCLLSAADLDMLDTVREGEEVSADLDGGFPDVGDPAAVPVIADRHELAEARLGEGGHRGGVVGGLIGRLAGFQFDTINC